MRFAMRGGHRADRERRGQQRQCEASQRQRMMTVWRRQNGLPGIAWVGGSEIKHNQTKTNDIINADIVVDRRPGLV
jgi:hypothetical protein